MTRRDASERTSDEAAREAPRRLSRFWRASAGRLVGLVARAWLSTLRVTVEVDPALAEGADRPWALAFFHGKQWPLLAWKRRRSTVVMVSLSDDGELQSRAMSTLGFVVVRGSSSRGGARGLARIVRLLKRGEHDAAFAVDGPRGPYGVPKRGIFVAARAADALVVPMGSAIAGGHVFTRAWDRFGLAWPFARVSVVLGAPVTVDASSNDTSGPTRLAGAIESANRAAEAILAAPRRSMLPFVRLPPSRPGSSHRV